MYAGSSQPPVPQERRVTTLKSAEITNIPQRALEHIAPVQALKDLQDKCPELFKMKVYNLTGLDSGRLSWRRGLLQSLLLPLAPWQGVAGTMIKAQWGR